MRNWKNSIQYRAAVVKRVYTVAEIAAVVRDHETYPSPVRAKGSHHSTTRCIDADGGTVLDMTSMNRILRIDSRARTITVQAGVLLIDAAKALERCGLQFYVNLELGNLTLGSGGCCGTKDASFHTADGAAYEYGQFCSYVVGFKAVRADGTLLVVDEQHEPELLPALRSSYGLLGIVYELTIRVKEMRPMAVYHELHHLDEFAEGIAAMVAEKRSSMLYMFPFLNRVVVERRCDGDGEIDRNSLLWRARNFTWRTISPAIGHWLTTRIRKPSVRYALVDGWCWVTILLLKLLRGTRTSAADQIIRYPETGDGIGYTFSFWAFNQDDYPNVLRAYFAFCRDYYRRTGFRCDMLNVGYAVAQDRSSLFSYTRNGPALTLDPVCTGGPGWREFTIAFNQFCHEHGGKPLLNQTPELTPAQVQAAYGAEIAQFRVVRMRLDPSGRFYNRYFRDLFGS